MRTPPTAEMNSLGACVVHMCLPRSGRRQPRIYSYVIHMRHVVSTLHSTLKGTSCLTGEYCSSLSVLRTHRLIFGRHRHTHIVCDLFRVLITNYMMPLCMFHLARIALGDHLAQAVEDVGRGRVLHIAHSGGALITYLAAQHHLTER